MVRGNWQKRVEQAEERRKEAKQKKVNKSSKSVYKNLVQTQLWPLLNQIQIPHDPGNANAKPNPKASPNILSIWVDTSPSSLKKSYHSIKDDHGDDAYYGDDVYDPENDGNNKNHNNNKQKSKSKSKKNQKHSNNGNNITPNKKLHPRSHELASPDTSRNKQYDDAELLLCRSHFFNGRCNKNKNGKLSKKPSSVSSSSSSSCQFYHFNSKKGQKTLFDSLSMSSSKTTKPSSTMATTPSKSHMDSTDTETKELLKKSSEAAATSYMKSIIGTTNSKKKSIDEDDEEIVTNTKSIYMLYYLEVDLDQQHNSIINHKKNSNNQDNDNGDPGHGHGHDHDNDEDLIAKVSDIVANTLSLEKCPIGSIVYTVYKNTLLFDRYKDGVIVTDEVCNDIFSTTGTYDGDDDNDTSYDQVEGEREGGGSHLGSFKTTTRIMKKEKYNLQILPVIALEHILVFLPDEASGIFSKICKDWNKEIGKTSPALWQYLLFRRNWPGPTMHEEGEEEEVGGINNNHPGVVSTLINKTREVFVSHKNICRAVDNIIDGIEYLQSNCNLNESIPSRHTLAMQRFNTSKENIGNCSTIRSWDMSTTITSHRRECILSITQVTKNDSSSLSCKQIVCVRVAPFPHSRKSACELRSFDLDVDSILCCFEVNQVCNWLTLVKREDLLLNSAESVLDKSVLRKYDVCDLMGVYFSKLVSTLDDHSNDNSIESLTTLFSEEDPPTEVSIHGDIVACGGGHFVFLVDMFQEDEDSLVLVGRAIVQFSVRKESLTWAQLLPQQMRPLRTRTLLSSYDSNTKTLICTSEITSPMIAIHVERRRGIISTCMYEDRLYDLYRNLNVDGWEVSESSPQRLSVVSKTHIILADVLTNEEETKSKVVLSFFHLKTIEYDEISILGLNELQRVLSMHSHGDYVVIMCEKGTGFEADEFIGHWFGEEDAVNQRLFFMIIVHIPSKTEIYRRACVDKRCDLSQVKLAFGQDSLPTVFAAKDQEGVLISGQALRDIETLTSPTKVSTKTNVKKKNKSLKNNKKDGFARGKKGRNLR